MTQLTNKLIDDPQLRITWMQRDNLPRVLEIAHQSPEGSPTIEELKRDFKDDSVIKIVGIMETQAVSFLTCDPDIEKIDLKGLAVHLHCRRYGIGKRMIAWLTEKLSAERTIIEHKVKETNVPAQLFLNKNDFVAVQTLRRHFPDDRDAYLFQYVRGGKVTLTH